MPLPRAYVAFPGELRPVGDTHAGEPRGSMHAGARCQPDGWLRLHVEDRNDVPVFQEKKDEIP